VKHDQGVDSFRRVEIPRRLVPGVSESLDVQVGGKAPVTGGFVQRTPHISLELGRYKIRLAETLAEREAACRLRFKVFNIELGEGLESSYQTGLDRDQFDLFCDHLIVEDRSKREVVGTYRMQTGNTAAQKLGYYSEQEFDFLPYKGIRSEVLELGRASIDREHRTSEVLTLLWRGIVQYARFYRLRYLIGCSSLNSRDPREGWSMYRHLAAFLASEPLRTRPTPAYELPGEIADAQEEVKVPKLLKTYIAVGARICGAPAWDREFGTIDFLTLLDLEQLSAPARNRFMPESEPGTESSRVSPVSVAPGCGC
jgi:putative hemolysin